MLSADLNAVGCFAKVVELESFRAAAAALGIPKSTLSRRIAELEDTLGVRLLERTTRRLRLTDAGQAYHLRVAPALDALREAERAVEEQNAKPSGALKLTMTIEGGQAVLGPILAEYLTLHPGVRLQVELTDRRVDLVEEGFDVAIRTGALPDSTLVAKRLSLVGAFRVYASPLYLARRGTPRHPRDLGAHDCLVMSAQRTPLTWAFQHRGKALPIKVRAHAEANSFALLHALAAAGHGIARLPDYLASQLSQADEPSELRELLSPFAPPPMPWQVVYPSSRHLSPKVRALVELLQLRLSQLQKWSRAGRGRAG
jgi:DNA-binding transcriptional LysR family regulator